jgi:predicted LPLAT superfamily acyltransferase
MHNPIEVPRDHPAFAGHFPQFPVLPGAVLLDEVLQVIQRERGIDLTQWQIASVKFLDVVRPGDALRLEHEARNGGVIRFTIRVADRIVASGSLSSATQAATRAGATLATQASAAPTAETRAGTTQASAAPAAATRAGGDATPQAAKLADDGGNADWTRHRERGSIALLRVMVFVSLRLGRALSRIPLYGIAVYFFLFAPSARRHSRRYLRLALGRAPGARDRFRQILSFATTIHDRVYLINQQFELFNITLEGETLLLAQVDSGRGALLMGAHMGSFEVMHSLGRRRRGLAVTMAMFEENARKINATLAAINPRLIPDIVSLGRIDAMLNIAERLERGAFIGVLGDRTLGHEPVQGVTLLGERAYLPTGPMRAAAILGCPVFFMAGLYRGRNNYHVVFEQIADFSATPAGARHVAVRSAIERYAAVLEQYCRSDPYNWFNFFDFWRTPRGVSST